MPVRPPQTHRRQILKGAAALGLSAALPRWSRLSAADAPAVQTDSKTKDNFKYNVFFIMSDDMRPELSMYGNPLVAAPNLAALAKSGVLFQRGYCQFPLCNPSRTSMLTGRQVITTGVMDNVATFWTQHPDLVTLPNYFRQHGYTTARTGKIFHFDDGPAWTVGGQTGATSEFDADPATPTDPAAAAPANNPATAPDIAAIIAHNRQVASSAGKTKAAYSDQIIKLEGDGQGHGDYATADRAIEYLRQYQDGPFFIGCGFVKPHSPPTAPERFFDQIPLDKIPLPVDYAPRRAVPEGFPAGCLRPNNADLFIGRDSTPETARQVIQAYLAAIAWCDWNIGRVIGELDRLGLREKTIIVFSADHGYQLGEKGKWSKAGSLWEEGARIPMFFSVPHAKGNGQICTRPVETLNLYPTLTELCSLPTPAGQEGRSMTKLLDDPKAEWNYPAYTVWKENGDAPTGYGVRVENWRYAEYNLGGPMLLDMVNDPHQTKNLAHDPKHADVAAKMADLIAQYKTGVFPRPALAAPIPAATAAAKATA
jgi:arylsulfatase A-like enzyme